MSIRKTRLAPDSNGLLDAAARPSSESDTLTYTCTLVTPMYGGGVKAGEVDLAMPIRATAIRGQLRFWWRLLNRKGADGKPRSSKELFEAERAIWGGLGDEKTLAKSKVRVRILPLPTATPNTSPFQEKIGTARHYALFAAAKKKGKDARDAAELLKIGYAFKLVVQTDPDLAVDDRQQVESAIRWWATFGGVGARTRRGAGAVLVKGADNKPLCVQLGEVEQQGWVLKLRGSNGKAETAWEDAVGALQSFRQKEGVGRNIGRKNDDGKDRPGRSFWPEPDAIRRITGRRSKDHVTPFCDVGDVFPRAAFGLPIGFQFKDMAAGDPDRTTLEPYPKGSGEDFERMASPLILRPYTSDGKTWSAAALRMDMDHVDAMGLLLVAGSEKLGRFPPGTWQPNAAAADGIKPLGGKANAIEAFLAYFSTQRADAAPSGGRSAAPPSKVKVYERPNISKRGDLIRVEPKGQSQRDIAGDDAKRLYSDLSDYARQRLDSGKQFNRLDITFDGSQYVSLKEHQE